MTRKLAIDFDDAELRIVHAQCNGNKVQVTDASVIAIAEGGSVSESLRGFIKERGLERTETLFAIGRGKAELRELQLPRVPEEELPDMVRFQAIRSFASASDRAVVDYLVTGQGEESLTVVAAAVSPVELDRLTELCGTSELIPKRIALRPLAAASMYLRSTETPPICVMIDLLSDDAEIVIARAGKVIFVRTVRLPSEPEFRSGAIASELHRTMIACGETSTPDRIVVWGREVVHRSDLEAIAKTIDCEDVQAVNPFDLVSLQLGKGQLPEHVGRLAPLVGLLASDESAPETLIDFLNPRQRVEEEPDRVRRLLMIALPLAAVFLVGFFLYRKLAEWDRRIDARSQEIALMRPSAEAADESIARTERIDQFLDVDVNWLDELKRFAKKAPPSDQLIVRSVSASANPRGGGGSLRISGAVTEPEVIDEMEESLRDETHSVVGGNTQETDRSDQYRWTFTETIVLTGGDLRNTRYQRMAERLAEGDSETASADGVSESNDNAATETSDPESGDVDASDRKSDSSETDPAAEMST